jgi:hypothetical protein
MRQHHAWASTAVQIASVIHHSPTPALAAFKLPAVNSTGWPAVLPSDARSSHALRRLYMYLAVGRRFPSRRAYASDGRYRRPGLGKAEETLKHVTMPLDFIPTRRYFVSSTQSIPIYTHVTPNRSLNSANTLDFRLQTLALDERSIAHHVQESSRQRSTFRWNSVAQHSKGRNGFACGKYNSTSCLKSECEELS